MKKKKVSSVKIASTAFQLLSSCHLNRSEAARHAVASFLTLLSSLPLDENVVKPVDGRKKRSVLTLRLPESLEKEAEKYVEMGLFHNKSELMRCALIIYLLLQASNSYEPRLRPFAYKRLTLSLRC